MSKKSIIPFSNGTEATGWLEKNCDHCKRRGCYAKQAVEKGFITGRISESIANEIGTNGDHLQELCNMKTVNPVNKAKRQPANQQTLDIK